MDKFKEFVSQHKEKFETNVDGGFECHVCDEYVTSAYYDRASSLLVWKCSQGHLSHLKEFTLG